jgi:hypothetical protein
VNPRAGLDDVEKRKFLTLLGFELLPSVVQPVSSRCTDYAIPAHNNENETENNNFIIVFKYPVALMYLLYTYFLPKCSLLSCHPYTAETCSEEEG